MYDGFTSHFADCVWEDGYHLRAEPKNMLLWMCFGGREESATNGSSVFPRRGCRCNMVNTKIKLSTVTSRCTMRLFNLKHAATLCLCVRRDEDEHGHLWWERVTFSEEWTEQLLSVRMYSAATWTLTVWLLYRLWSQHERNDVKQQKVQCLSEGCAKHGGPL